MAITFTPIRRSGPISRTTSSVAPEFDKAKITSSRPTIPRSP